MNILDEIIKVKKSEVKELHRDYSISRFSDSPFFNKKRKSLFSALTQNSNISIISEIKKASPSKGIIRNDFNHLKIAESYLENRTDAISILTDKNFFMGDIKYLSDIAVFSEVPLLRKDFIIDEYQVLEAKSFGADAILLIAENLAKSQIEELTAAANENELEVLLELHSEEQISKLNFDLNRVIGINNRNLENFSVDLETTTKISKLMPESVLIVSESGISTENDIQKLKKTRTNAVLVGEHFMRHSDPGMALKQLKLWCINED